MSQILATGHIVKSNLIRILPSFGDQIPKSKMMELFFYQNMAIFSFFSLTQKKYFYNLHSGFFFFFSFSHSAKIHPKKKTHWPRVNFHIGKNEKNNIIYYYYYYYYFMIYYDIVKGGGVKTPS